MRGEVIGLMCQQSQRQKICTYELGYPLEDIAQSTRKAYVSKKWVPYKYAKPVP